MNTTRYPQLAYWKWGPEFLEGDAHLQAVRRFFQVGRLTHLVILMDLGERGYNHPEAMKRLREMVAESHRLGGKLVFGVDIRYLAHRLAVQYPDDRYGVAEILAAPLDGQGQARLTYRFAWGRLAPVEKGLLRAVAFKPAGSTHYVPGSLSDVTRSARILEPDPGAEESTLCVDAGVSYAGLRVAVLPFMRFERLDLFSPHALPEYAALMDRFRDVPLDGMMTDEMGTYIPHDPGYVLRKFHYSRPLAEAYRRHTGHALVDDILAFRFAPAECDGERTRVINQYFEVIRTRMVQIESFVYRETKRRYGPDAFVGLHPTFWNESAHEVFHDGLDWWDCPRDYAQTDEHIGMATRMALSRKAGPVWYNMWYTMGELTMESYFREAWRYAEFGGRMHYHSYFTHSEKKLVGEIHRPGDLERVAELEHAIRKLNAFQRTQPDARVAVVVGYASLVNWTLTEPDLESLPPDRGRFLDACRFADGLIQAGWLCDLFPDYELEHGELAVAPDGRVQYGCQAYDAVICLFPDGVKRSTLDGWQRIRDATDRILLVGDCRQFFDGTPATSAFAAFQQRVSIAFPTLPEVDAVVQVLREWRVPGHRLGNGCVYQDGSAIFVSGGERPCGNPLTVDAVLQGHRIQARGRDFLGVRLDADGRPGELVHNGLTELFVDNQSYPDLCGTGN